MAKICRECGYETEYGVDMTYCPVCEGYLEDAGRCKRCGEIVAEVELDEGWCKECQDTLVNNMIHSLKTYFTPIERKMFREFVTEEDFDAIWED